MLTIEIDWPDAALSPNGRAHHFARARAAKKAKNDAWGWTKALMPKLGIAYGSWRGPVTVQYTFHPMQDRGRDDDNFIARCKAARDGIALALGIDDKAFVTLPVIWGDKRTGKVVVTLTPATVILPVRGGIA